MDDTEPQTAAAKVLWHFTMSLDGFVAGPAHDMHWLTGVAVLSCPVEEAVQIALDAAGGKNVEVFSPTIGRQLLERGLIDEIDLHIAPILLGAGIRLYDNPAADGIIRLHRVGDGDPASTVNVRYRPVTTGRSAAGSPGAAQALDREGIPC